MTGIKIEIEADLFERVEFIQKIGETATQTINRILKSELENQFMTDGCWNPTNRDMKNFWKTIQK